MGESTPAYETALWVRPDRTDLARRIVAAMDGRVKVIAVGGPRAAEVAELAATFDKPCCDDLRQMLIDHPAAFLLLASSEPLKRTEVEIAEEHQTRILTLEPLASVFDEVAALRRPKLNTPLASIALAPCFQRSRAWLSATDPQSALGEIRSISHLALGRADHASLFALLFDAWLTVLAFGGFPETIDASLVSAQHAGVEDLRDVDGHVIAHARMSGGQSAVLHVSNHAPRTERCLTVVGEDGFLRLLLDGYELITADGQTVDEPHTLAPTDMPIDKAPGARYVQQVAEFWTQMIDRPNLAIIHAAGPEAAQALACCQASLLSTRTDQPESPRRMLEMHQAI